MSVAREAAPGRGIEDPLTVMQGGYKVSLSLVACVLVCTHECVCMSAMCSRVHVRVRVCVRVRVRVCGVKWKIATRHVFHARCLLPEPAPVGWLATNKG